MGARPLSLRDQVRIIWSRGGAWECFFQAWLVGWPIYWVVFLAWENFYFQPFEFQLALFWSGLSFFFLMDAWLVPIFFSSQILRSLASRMESEDREKALDFADHLDSRNQGSRWLVANRVSLTYAIVLIALSLAAVSLLDITRPLTSWLYLLIHIGLVVLFVMLYRGLLERFMSEAARQGQRWRLRKRWAKFWTRAKSSRHVPRR